MYVSSFYVRGNNDLAFELEEYLSSLGYYRASSFEKADLIVNVGYLGAVMKLLLKKVYKRIPVIINVTANGEYIIPLTREKSGGSFLSQIIAEKTGGEVVLTSRSSLMGVYSPEEFAWLNGLYFVNGSGMKRVYKTLEEKGELSVYYEGVKLKFPKGYSVAEDIEEADLVVNVFDRRKPSLYAYTFAIGIMISEDVPERVIQASTELTAKSLGLYHERLTKRFVFRGNDPVLCEDMLRIRGFKVLLKGTKRAKGVHTCLGIQLRGLQPVLG